METVITNNDSTLLTEVGNSPNNGLYADTKFKYESKSKYDQTNTYNIYSSTKLNNSKEYVTFTSVPYSTAGSYYTHQIPGGNFFVDNR